MFPQVEKQLVRLLQQSIERYAQDLSLAFPKNLLDSVTLEIPKEKEFGDFSCTIALKLSGIFHKSPKEIAEGLSVLFKDLSSQEGAKNLVKDVQIKGAGFINIFLQDKVFFDVLREVNTGGDRIGRTDLGHGERLLVEFVSANPTGPLSVAHARQAAVGDALANILDAAGFKVQKEYYLNDEGNQINILGRSIHLRFKELCGEVVQFPEDHYQGQYIVDLARVLWDDEKSLKKIQKLDPVQREQFFVDYGVEKIRNVIKKELDDFGVDFDVWYSQRELGRSGKIEHVLAFLKEKGLVYEAEGALWFKSTQFGDDKDRVLKKSDGTYTYITPDIAYHEDKFKRGFQRLINLWGPDHHGYIPRIRAAIAAFGHSPEALKVVIVQLATLFRQGVPVPMSTRKGQYVTLREVLTEVGRDASRFFFLMRKTDSHLDFDLELAKKQTSENPVYYIQYAHARISSILAGAGKPGTDPKKINLFLLIQQEERDLMKVVFEFHYCLFVCAQQADPYNLTTYLQSLAAAFHKFYDKHKVLSSDEELTKARLFLIRAVKVTLAQGLRLAGVSAPEKM